VSPRRRSAKAPKGSGRSSSRAVTALAVMGAVVALYGWNSVFLGPKNTARAAVSKELSAARQTELDLRANMAQLRKLAADTRSREAELANLGRLIPADADIDGAILALDDAAKQAQVSMATFIPSPPAVGAAGAPATVGLSMTIDGTFDQIFDYLRRVETLDRLVVIDSLQLAGGGNGAGSPGAGPQKLSAQIKARLFSATGPAAPVVAAAAAEGSDPAKMAALPKAGG
jgi:type IV pilus assembly protein PilO